MSKHPADERLALVGDRPAIADVRSIVEAAGVEIVSPGEATMVIAAVRGQGASAAAALREAVGDPGPGVVLGLDLDRHRVADFADLWSWPERVVGLRILRRPPGRGVLEVVAGPATGRAALARARALATRLDLDPVRCADRAGFLLGRLERAIPRPSDVDGAEEIADWSEVLATAGQLLDHGDCSARDLETAAREGLGWDLSPLDVMNRIWEGEGRARIPDSFRVRRQARARVGFGHREVRGEVSDGVATLWLRRPHTLNALEPALLSRIEETFDLLDRDPAVRTIVFRSESEAFMAGVETTWILEQMEADDFRAIRNFVERAQALFRRIESSGKHTLVCLEGLAAGAGGELLCCVDAVIATPRGSILFPETSIGIYPALGGTQRLPRRIGCALARWLVLAGEPLRASDATHIGLVDMVVEAAKVDDAVRWSQRRPSLRQRACDVARAPARLDGVGNPKLRRLQEAFAEVPLATMLRPQALTGSAREVEAAFHRVRRRAPRALTRADELLSLACSAALEVGLRAEIDRLRSVYDTLDALTGIRARAAGKRSVVFTGS